jgi:hypothetical protein
LVTFELPLETVTTTFLPKSQFSPTLDTYRFAIRYHSEQAPINVADLELLNHLWVTNEGAAVTVHEIIPSNDGHTADVDYVLSPINEDWPNSVSILKRAGAIRDLNGGSHLAGFLTSLSQSSSANVHEVSLVGGRLIEDDPLTHRLSFFSSDTSQLDQSVLSFGGRSGMFASFEESEEIFPSLVGRLLEIASGIATFELDRPDPDWGAWEANRLPYSFHLAEGEGANGGLITSGHVTVHSELHPLPLLFSFEEWVRRLEEQADLPEGSLEGDADGDGMDSVVDYALGSDLQDKNNTSKPTTAVVEKDGQRHLELEFPVRSNSIGLKPEVQHSTDGVDWQTADEDFEVVDRNQVQPEVLRLRIQCNEPLAARAPVGFYRIAIAR